MRRVTPPALLIAILVSHGIAADDSNAGPKFKKVVPTDAIRFAVADSQDGQASTMIFDNFDVATDVAEPSEPDVRTRMFTYVRRIETTKDSCVEQDLRGFVSRNGSASATMIVHSGGRTTVVDLKKAIEDAKKNVVNRDCPTRKSAEQAADDQGFDEDEPEGESDDFFVSISTLVPKGRSLQTTIILLVDRSKGDDESSALLTLDSIDSEVRAK